MLDSQIRIAAHPLVAPRAERFAIRAAIPDVFKPDTIARATNLGRCVNELIRETAADYLLLFRPSVILEEGLFRSCANLIEDLSRDFANWGVCGASGVRGDGARVYWYLRRPPRNAEAGASPKLVTSVGSEILLLNVEQLRALNCSIPDTMQWWEVGPLLALECLKGQSCVLADRRLMVVDPGKEPVIGQANAIRQSCLKSFLNHRVETPYGWIEIPKVPHDEHLHLPPLPHGKRDILSCYDAALAAARRSAPLSLTVACRTQLNRPHLLQRALLSFAAAQVECPPSLSFRVALVSEQERGKLLAEVAQLKQLFPALEILPITANTRSRATSRVDHLLSAITEIDTDYLWFIDDDDFIMPGAVPALARILQPHAPVLAVGTCEVYEECWEDGQLKQAHPFGLFPSNRIFEVFSGENYVPICGMILPRPLAHERCSGVDAHGEYLEDYFVLMRVLTSSRIEVETIPNAIAGISLRGSENTVREATRVTWERSYAGFMSEIVRREDSSNPFLWQLSQFRPSC